MNTLILLVVGLAYATAVYGTECGQTPIAPNLNGFIVGGVEARKHSIPWQIGLGQRWGSSMGGQICGGSIVSDRIVITAAHCISSGAQYYVAVGQHSKSSADSYTKKIQVTKAITHPNWNARKIVRYDIAILQLAEPIRFNQGVQPICLPKAGEQYSANTNFLVSGWGTTRENGRTSDKLMQLVVPHIETRTCQSYLGSNVHSDVICAGYLNGGKDSCQGDSGGPLATRSNGKWTLAGVVSWGYGCARAGNPGVYTNVASYMDFVNQYV